jgi:hypothetical protein
MDIYRKETSCKYLGHQSPRIFIVLCLSKKRKVDEYKVGIQHLEDGATLNELYPRVLGFIRDIKEVVSNQIKGKKRGFKPG